MPRICHFLDLVLPQLTPVRAPWADATRTLWTCHHIRASSHENGYPYEPRVRIAYFFTSHDHIHHARVLWGTLPLLLFSDPRMVYPVDVNQFQGQAVHRLHQQHIQDCVSSFRKAPGNHLGLSTGRVAVFEELCKKTIGSCWDAGITPCCCAAIAVLWLALAPKRFPLQADTFSRAAGTAGKQKWSLILPTSARVSELTYVTIIGTRYPELDNFQNDIIQFGNYLQAEQCTRGGFLPIFLDAPYSYINASTDIGEVVDWITSLWWPTKVILRSSTTATKWSMPLATRNGFQAQVEQSSREVSRPVLV